MSAALRTILTVNFAAASISGSAELSPLECVFLHDYQVVIDRHCDEAVAVLNNFGHNSPEYSSYAKTTEVRRAAELKEVHNAYITARKAQRRRAEAA